MEIKMSTNEVNQNSDVAVENHAGMNMECVNRITKLPVVESTIHTATAIYGKVKDYNSLTNWTLSTAENTVHKAVEVGKPLAGSVAHQLEGPIKKVDGYLCSGLDYVEAKIPAVKLPPAEMYTTTKDYVNNTVAPAVQSACAKVQPAVKTAREVLEPAVQAAKHAVEPSLQNVRQIAEPLVHPVVEKATALKDYGTQKVEEFFHLNNHTDNAVECTDCIENAEKKEKSKENSQ